jgi:iron complex transport system ATP-binding protein
MSIAAEHIEVRRASRTVLHDVSLILAEGECVCVVGPNGAGKSTLMLALAGLIPAASGRTLLDGRPLHHRSRRQIARPGFRVRDVLAAARFAHQHPLAASGDLDQQVIAEQVDACDLGNLLDRTIGTLSAGERQKVWLAAALVQEPRFLLLDEPTSALDAKYVATLIRLLRLQQSRGRGVLVICHDLNVAAALGGRIIALASGRVAFDGPIGAFLEPAHLLAVFGVPFHLCDVPGAAHRFAFPEC